MTFLKIALLFSWFSVRNYTNHSIVYDVADKDSEVFIATNGGIMNFSDVYFEGDTAHASDFHLYASYAGLPHNIILSLALMGDTLWALPVTSGLYYMLPYENEFKRYFVPYSGINTARKIRISYDLVFLKLANAFLRIKLNHNLDPQDDNIFVISTDSIGDFVPSDDTLYFSRKDTLFVEPIFSNVPVYSIAFQHDITTIFKKNRLLVGTDRGIFIQKDSAFTFYPLGRIYGLCESNDTVLVASQNGAYFIVHNDTIRVAPSAYKFFSFKNKYFLSRLFYSPENTNYNAGIQVLESGNLLSLSSGLQTNFVTSLDVLRGKVYFGTLDWSDKPLYLDSKGFYIDPYTGMSHPVNGIGNSAQDAIRTVRVGNGSVFLGAYALNSSGLFVVRDSIVMQYTDFPSLLFTDLAVANDTFVALWGDGIYRWTGMEKRLVYSINYPSYITLDSANRLWIGTEASGIIVVKKNGEIIRAINYELPSQAITALVATGEDVIAGTDAGLCVFRKSLSPKILLHGKHIRSLATDRYKRVFALTDSALYFIDVQAYNAKCIVSSPPIIPQNAADWEVRNVLAIDNNLNTYIGSKEGILVIKLDEPAEYKQTGIRIFPNPVIRKNSFTICAENIFRVLDIKGSKVFEFNAGCHKVTSDKLSSGLYTVIDGKGEKAKFIVKE